MSLPLKFVILIIFSYFIGNLSNARIISKLLKRDITKEGSGNPGTMNMLRTFGFKVGILTLFLDVIKGSIPALFGFYLFGGVQAGTDAYIGLYTAGLSVVLGHNFPLLYKFKGGKGVACILGVYAVAEPLWALIAFVGCFIYLYFFDYGAIASFIFITVLTVVEALKFKQNIVITVLLLVLYFLTWFMHRKNINRLLLGKENKVNLKRSLQKMAKKERKIINKEQKREDKTRDIG